jgi:hypothetical protein
VLLAHQVLDLRYARANADRCIRRGNRRPERVPWALAQVCRLRALHVRELVLALRHAVLANGTYRVV